MKKVLFFIAMMGFLPISVWAQDDLYFTPSKDKTVKTQDAPTYYCGSDRDVDEYNRRGNYRKIGTDSLGNDIIEFDAGNSQYPELANDSLLRKYQQEADDFEYTRRMGRYDDFYGWYDPWFYGYRGWRGFYPWYDPWFDPWDPWYYGWGGYYGIGWYSWYGWYNPWYYGWGYPYHHYAWIAPVFNHHRGGLTGTRNHTYTQKGGRGVRDFSKTRTVSPENDNFGSRSTRSSRYDNSSFGNRSGSFGSSRSGGGSFGGHSGGSFGGGSRSGGGGGHFGGRR